MHQVIALFIPIIGIIGVITLIIVIKRLEHIEKLQMIEKGLDISKFQRPHKPGGAIKIALMAIGIGIGIFAGNLLESYTTLNDETCYFAMIFIFAGAGLFLGNIIADKKVKESQDQTK